MTGPQTAPRVSIPFWVFSPLRLRSRRDARRAHPRFNPVLGFLSAATLIAILMTEDADVFQSRSGFSLRCDHPRSSGLTRPTAVSIPFWVFSPLRPNSATRSKNRASCFNPVLGFLSAATRALPQRILGRSCFNPVLGFLSAATKPLVSRESPNRVSIPFWVFSPLRQFKEVGDGGTLEMFQSRSGFSLRCDRQRRLSTVVAGRVSIPFWVFSPLRPVRVAEGSSFGVCFNPVLGFLSAATVKETNISPWNNLFQSRSGFSLRCDAEL